MPRPPIPHSPCSTYRLVGRAERAELVLAAVAEREAGAYGPAAAALVESTIPLALRLLSRRGLFGNVLDDAVQEAALAGYEAVRRHDPVRSEGRDQAVAYNTTFTFAMMGRASGRAAHEQRHPFPLQLSDGGEEYLAVDDSTDESPADDAAETVAELLEQIPRREADVIRRCFGVGRVRQTLTAAAADLGVTKDRVRQIRDRALGRLRVLAVRKGVGA